MNRVDVLQSIIDRKKNVRYLEIGVDRGRCFLLVRARRKYAVDPRFGVAWKSKVKWALKNPCNLHARYYEGTSDDYFAQENHHEGYDVVFVDGLHTYRQALADVLHSLSCLRGGGVVVMHDCNPLHEAAAGPANSYAQAASLNRPAWDGVWCGDVWKAVCYLRTFRKDLHVFVLDCDYGLGIVTPGEPESMLTFTQEELDRLTYMDLEKDRKGLLNLKTIDYLRGFLDRVG